MCDEVAEVMRRSINRIGIMIFQYLNRIVQITIRWELLVSIKEKFDMANIMLLTGSQVASKEVLECLVADYGKHSIAQHSRKLERASVLTAFVAKYSRTRESSQFEGR